MSLESDNAQRLAQELLAAETPHYRATLPILAYSTRSLGNAFSELEDGLMPDVIKAKQGEAHDNHRRLFETDPLEPSWRWFLARTSQHPNQTRARQLDIQEVQTRSETNQTYCRCIT